MEFVTCVGGGVVVLRVWSGLVRVWRRWSGGKLERGSVVICD